MQNKKLLIIIGVAILLVAAGAFAFFLLKNRNHQTAQNNNQQNSQASSGSGGVGSTPPAVAGFHIFQDPGQPFTALLPRQGNSSAVAIQPAPGPVPDQNQPAPTISSGDVSNPDYANLSGSDFLSKYYPNATQVITGQTPGDIAQQQQDPVLVDNSANTATITDNPNVSSSLFKITNANDPQSQLNYVTQLSNATSKFDLVNSPQLLTDPINDPTKINSSKTQAQQVMTDIQNIPVPDSMVGLSKDYFSYYQAYINFMTDYQNSFNSASPAAVTRDEATLQKDMDTLTGRLTQVNQDIINARQLLP